VAHCGEHRREVIGAVEVIDRGSNQAKPRRKRAKYLDTRSGRLRLAVIADNSAASIAAFVRANVKPGTTLPTDGHASYPGVSGYRHDPRVVGAMAGHVVLPWIHRAFSLLKRWALGTYHGLRRNNEFVFRYNRRFYRHVSFEALPGLATHHEPTSYWDIIKRDNPRKSTDRPGGSNGHRPHPPIEKTGFECHSGAPKLSVGAPKYRSIIARNTIVRDMPRRKTLLKSPALAP
jgi:hypothetical protein